MSPLTFSARTAEPSGGGVYVPSAELPDLLLLWSKQCRNEPALAPLIDAWQSLLQPGSPFWRLGRQDVAEVLVQTLETVTITALSLQQEPGDRRPALLETWLKHTELLRGKWPPRTPGDWKELLASDGAGCNPLVAAVVSRALSAGLDKARLPQKMAASLLPLIQQGRQLGDRFPLPPATGYTLPPGDYYFAARNSAAWRNIDERLSAILPWIAVLGTSECGTAGGAGLQFAWSAAQRLTAGGCEGWPIRVTDWAARQADLAAALGPPALSDAACPPLLRDKIAVIYSELVRAGGALTPGSTSHEHPFPKEESCAATSSPAVPADKELPVSGSSAEGLSAAVALSLLIQQFLEDPDPRAQIFGRRLATLLTDKQGRDDADSVADDAYQRRLLACLLYLDDLLFLERRVPGWVVRARNSMRSLLTEEGCYAILDSQLLGRAPETCPELVEAIGLVESREVRSGGIAIVAQPGYQLRESSGVTTVLCRAKVLLAR